MSLTPVVQDQEGTGDRPARRWAFGTAVLDERTLELVVNGETVSVERKPLEVLLFLLHHAGEVATKDEILEAVWPGRILTETVLTKAIGRIREALGDESQTLIKTQHGYGYRLIAPVKVEASTAPSLPRFDFKPGDSPPLRPRWKLEERLGTGGHGEAWLGRHEKTREVRVYKFALDSTALGSLKREITIYRLLHDALPERTDFVSILDWNLEEPPYFLEIEHAGLNLVQWAEAQGGLLKVPLETRLEIAAQIAEALAAAHSVGVLHKDLKPSNVLVVSDAAGMACPTETESVGRPVAADGGTMPRPTIKLSDFGSGGVLDPGRLEALGITRLGFTKTVVATGTTSGTPIYFAPEVIAGQPFTVQADIYALGVMLYQLIVGDLKKSLAPGWEQDVEDGLLKEDVASAAAGDVNKRLPDASRLAQRIRTLSERRQQRDQDKEEREQARRAKEEAERARQRLERLRARRIWMVAAMAALTVGLGASLALFVRSERARSEAEAVSTFLVEDVLSTADAGRTAIKDVSLADMLDRAAAMVEKRLQGQPDAMARVRLALAEIYLQYYAFDAARVQSEAAAALLQGRYGPDDPRTLSALVLSTRALGPATKWLDIYEDLLDRLVESLPADHPDVVTVRAEIALGRSFKGDPESAIEELQVLMPIIERDPAGMGPTLRIVSEGLVTALIQAARFREAEAVARQAVALHSQIYGDAHWHTGWARLRRAWALWELGRLDEAETELNRASADIREWVGSGHTDNFWLLAWRGILRLEQARYIEAQTDLREATGLCVAIPDCPAIWSAEAKLLLGRAHEGLGQLSKAEELMREAMAVIETEFGVYAPRTLNRRIELADVLRQQGHVSAARELIGDIPADVIRRLPDRHTTLANLRRIEGLLWMTEGNLEKARSALTEALEIYQLRHGDLHWRTKRAREELARVPAASAAKAAGRS